MQHAASHARALCHTHNTFAATHCNTLKHTATHCNTLQHTATLCNALQRTATHAHTLYYTHNTSACVVLSRSRTLSPPHSLLRYVHAPSEILFSLCIVPAHSPSPPSLLSPSHTHSLTHSLSLSPVQSARDASAKGKLLYLKLQQHRQLRTSRTRCIQPASNVRTRANHCISIVKRWLSIWLIWNVLVYSSKYFQIQ